MQTRFVGLHLFALDFLFCPYNLPRKKVTSIRITTASSIDGSRSKATSYKLDTPVSGGAYQVACEVTLVWNGA